MNQHLEPDHEHVLTPALAAASHDRDIGGKARGLARLATVGAPVPPWIAVASSASLDHVAAAPGFAAAQRALFELARCDLDDHARVMRLASHASELFEAAILARPLDGALADAILAAAAPLRERSDAGLAVRSSMVGEDSASHSFAGQLESFLFQREDADVLDSVRRCWASAYSPRALAYRLRAGLDVGVVQVCVVVQAMIEGDVSGVMFTAHPLTGRRDHALITAAWGAGEGVVSGACNTDEFVATHDGDELDVQLADKDLELVRDPSGGVSEVDITDDARRHGRSLTASQVAELGRWAGRLGELEGAPHDVEWTLRDGELFLLQARPITSLPSPPAPEDGPAIYFDNANIQESYCGVTTPLTYSFASYAYLSVYVQTFRVLGIPEERLDEMRPALGNLLGLIKGRIYYNLNNWYRGLQILPSFGQNKEDMESMMGVEEPVDFVEDELLGALEKLRRAPRLIETWARLQRRFARLDDQVPAFLTRFDRMLDARPRERLDAAPLHELVEMVREVEREFLDGWETPIVNDFYTMMSVGSVRRIVESSGVDNPAETLSDLLGGEEGIESTEPTYALMRIAAKLRASKRADWPELSAELEPSEFLARVAADEPSAARDIEAYVSRYGDRTMGELKLETITLREDRDFLARILDNYMSRPDLKPQDIQRRERERRRAAEARVGQRLGRIKRARLSRALDSARSAVKHRENMRLARTRLFGLFRAIYLAIGARLAEAGELESPRDVMYLTREEILAWSEGRAVTTDLSGLVALRRAEFDGYRAAKLPHRIVTRGVVHVGNSFEAPPVSADALSANVLRGTGCYAGAVTERLKVIMDPSDELRLDGQILTTLRTDPGWAPLFPTAGGVLVERGSTLSHSAVVARELGIPAVVGVPDLLAIVRDGERVTLDGAAGTVTRHDATTDDEEE